MWQQLSIDAVGVGDRFVYSGIDVIYTSIFFYLNVYCICCERLEVLAHNEDVGNIIFNSDIDGLLLAGLSAYEVRHHRCLLYLYLIGCCIRIKVRYFLATYANAIDG